MSASARQKCELHFFHKNEFGGVIQIPMADRKTTVEEVLPFLRLIKYAGIFPYRFDYKTLSVGRERLQKFEKLGIDRSWKYGVYRVMVWTYMLLRYAVVILNNIRLFALNSFDLNAMCSNIFIGTVLTLTLILNGRMKWVVKLLNGWHGVDACLEPMPKRHHKTCSSLSLCNMSIRKSLAMMLLLQFFINFTASITFPRYKLFLYSSLDPKLEIFWFKVLSALDTYIFSAIFSTQLLHLDLLVVSLPDSIQNSLAIICPGSRNLKLECSAHPHLEQTWERRFKTTLRIYIRLEELVNHFNEFYGVGIIGIQSIYMLCFCLAFYIPVRHPELLNGLSFAIFLVNSSYLLQDVTGILQRMGDVQSKALHFKEAWTEELISGDSTSVTKRLRQIQILNCGPTISFVGGGLYSIQSFTTLTYLSIATSYIIVALQF